MRVILKDKKDLNVLRTREDIWSNEDYDIVGSQDEIKRDINVELLSVKFSKVGQKTFDNYFFRPILLYHRTNQCKLLLQGKKNIHC